ncbi:symmetrical bis(5'-nucleosyl)-tetraphosphatase [Candidatus Kinetoplastidibacterium crithidiae]|uniref:bis(5'-nucleosyl)-tetraphosphatase (symmetrical) n=1 Tax=Candidatus Kinetoplastidibacterium crithidiae TCC036E TaxID=1208918 RepID=M1L5I8_9PROT|nr:symmetrical bis(5'-nucleosyl)-tetraphosphatase [Candidatus Kinetoplastibacterium crithidii]AFZ82903.1 bis(5'-nucleosyl)-tetraphosphatase [Candidatus Kinetoplastibacterium crithidii (ex Angomonas deanei ATCC 30255)]AGF47903.1 bis(5'-nucleosyl)-tetraphosphatase (symmetrical) [Candidatus Kinetoplastibacterium crithidii TCC036E]
MNEENTWVIGDVQGCYCHLKKLLSHEEIISNPKARFWFAGDLVNRGPDSLGAIEYIMSLDEKSVCVLGNHDLNLLGVFAGLKEYSKSDHLNDILHSSNSTNIINWLRHRPLAHFEHNYLMVHAGVLPQWDINKVMSLASEIQELLRSANWQKTIKKIFGNKVTQWNEDLTGGKRIRAIVNALTRIRFCNADGSMNFSQKKSPENRETKQLIPWFNMPDRATKNIKIVFGHWSSLGLFIKENIMCLDSGCVWGRNMTAMRLKDKKTIQISCKDLSN